MPLRIVELLLEIVKLAMESAPPDVRADMWRMHLDDMKRWRKFLGIEETS